MTSHSPAATFSVTINGQPREVPSSASILDAVLDAGIDLPHLCKDLDGPALGASS